MRQRRARGPLVFGRVVDLVRAGRPAAALPGAAQEVDAARRPARRRPATAAAGSSTGLSERAAARQPASPARVERQDAAVWPLRSLAAAAEQEDSLTDGRAREPRTRLRQRRTVSDLACGWIHRPDVRRGDQQQAAARGHERHRRRVFRQREQHRCPPRPLGRDRYPGGPPAGGGRAIRAEKGEAGRDRRPVSSSSSSSYSSRGVGRVRPSRGPARRARLRRFRRAASAGAASAPSGAASSADGRITGRSFPRRSRTWTCSPTSTSASGAWQRSMPVRRGGTRGWPSRRSHCTVSPSCRTGTHQ